MSSQHKFNNGSKVDKDETLGQKSAKDEKISRKLKRKKKHKSNIVNKILSGKLCLTAERGIKEGDEFHRGHDEDEDELVGKAHLCHRGPAL